MIIYPVDPIKTSFDAEKTKAWHYRAHPYYTKQPTNVVGEYIKHFCPRGGHVVDPFCGTGVTAIEALTNKCKTTCLDLDPLATFITRQTCITPVDIEQFSEATIRIKSSLLEIIEFTRNAKEKEIEAYEITSWYPKKVRLPSNADRKLVEEIFYKDHLIILSKILEEIKKVDDLQTRQLLLFAFSGILHRASLTFIEWEGSGGHSTLFQQYRYYVPKRPGKLDVWNLFERKCLNITKLKKTSEELFGKFFIEGDSFNIHTDNAENLLEYVDEKSVDYIYTDPPYGAHISYLDLSTMYHAWLGFSITDEMRNSEAIEGGELHLSESHYLEVLQKSFEKMYISLKDNAWLSLVFHHKKTNLWYSIRDMMRFIGIKYVNTVVQPLSWTSWHKRKNPLKVLGESLIVNFQKDTSPRITKPIALPLANLINNVAERVIYKNAGASTEEILREVIPELFENDLFIDVSSQKIGDIITILESEFELDNENLWQIKSERTIGNFIPPRVRIKYYVISYLRKHKKANFDDIITWILPRLVNGHKHTKNDIENVLDEIGKSIDGVTWELIDRKNLNIQQDLPFSSVTPSISGEYSLEIPESTKHNQLIYRLAIIGQRLGYSQYIGRNERSDPMLAVLKPITNLNTTCTAANLNRIEQIDLIWADNNGNPIWAFEVEEHTTILSALKRFTLLLKEFNGWGVTKSLKIISPRSRRKKLLKELTTSSYIGHPLYMETKINYIFSEDLTESFKRIISNKRVSIELLRNLCQTVI